MLNSFIDYLRRLKAKYYVFSKFLAEYCEDGGAFSSQIKRSFRGPISPVSTDKLSGRDPRELNVLSILDEFSFLSYSYEFKLTPVPRKNPASCLGNDVDMLFCESSWAGSGGQWSFKKPSHRAALKRFVKACRKRGIPTVFWCKEDPVHFSMFIKIASYFDYVFTSDENCVPKYREMLGHDRVNVLPFAVQPMEHNPYTKEPRENCVCFAGSYYQKRYPERGQALRDMFDASLPDLVIYDRNSERNHPFYKFPKEYESYVRPRLPYAEIFKAYKGCKIGININTVTGSDTMFSRRVYELLACGTPIISNESEGMEKLFPMVYVAKNVEDTHNYIKSLLSDEREWKRISEDGIRAVMSEHTYRKRAALILKSIGAEPAAKKSELCAAVNFDAEAWLEKQTVKPSKVYTCSNDIEKGSRVLLVNADSDEFAFEEAQLFSEYDLELLGGKITSDTNAILNYFNNR